MTEQPSTARRVTAIIPASRTTEGGGFTVFRPFPTAELDWIDPFLLLDEMAPIHHPPGEAVGAPAHPHRGFETVTYVLQGEVEHRDSAGHHGLIGAGDVQWMTAGDGIVHSEMPSERIQTQGGVGHGLQLWVNLPASLRRTQPRYQALTNDALGRASGDGWSIEAIAGEFLGALGPAATHTPIGLARATVEPDTTLTIPLEDGHTAAVYAFAGEAELAGSPHALTAHQLAVFERSGSDLVLDVPASATGPFDALILTGEPIGEPMVRSGPFVMNTSDEITEAFDDYRAGRMGAITATGTA